VEAGVADIDDDIDGERTDECTIEWRKSETDGAAEEWSEEGVEATEEGEKDDDEVEEDNAADGTGPARADSETTAVDEDDINAASSTGRCCSLVRCSSCACASLCDCTAC